MVSDTGLRVYPVTDTDTVPHGNLPFVARGAALGAGGGAFRSAATWGGGSGSEVGFGVRECTVPYETSSEGGARGGAG